MNWWKEFDKSELVTSALLVALGAYIMAEAWQWPYLTKDGPGPGFFPFWIGLCIIALAILLTVLQVVDILKRQPAERVDWAKAAPVLVGWAGLMISIALLEVIGFIASFMLLVVFIVSGVFRRSFTAALAVGIGASIGFWVLFVYLLQVQLPAGPWGF